MIVKLKNTDFNDKTQLLLAQVKYFPVLVNEIKS